ncbi:hypothetical protein TIFTF001_022257 [Ficus carica]|uniref:Uncharacterized protein n=1 Tax=Ficus carica TaxID=3494 RepID=A0AA88ATF6_FICCA|nr:hypothetical protein TIFTF001_022257 [Ficus carica]
MVSGSPLPCPLFTTLVFLPTGLPSAACQWRCGLCLPTPRPSAAYQDLHLLFVSGLTYPIPHLGHGLVFWCIRHGFRSFLTGFEDPKPGLGQVSFLTGFVDPKPGLGQLVFELFGDPKSGLGQVYKECNHLRHEGLRNKKLYYNVFEKNHAAGASGYGSVTMRDDSTAYVGHECSMDNSGNRADLEEDLTLTTSARHWNNIRSGTEAGPSRSRGSSGKRKQRDETYEMTFMAMQKIVSHFRG